LQMLGFINPPLHDIDGPHRFSSSFPWFRCMPGNPAYICSYFIHLGLQSWYRVHVCHNYYDVTCLILPSVSHCYISICCVYMYFLSCIQHLVWWFWRIIKILYYHCYHDGRVEALITGLLVHFVAFSWDN